MSEEVPFTWRLRIRECGRWEDMLSFLGWRYRWEVIKWASPGYGAPDLFGWSGRARSAEDARHRAEEAFEGFAHPPKPRFVWTEWYRDD